MADKEKLKWSDYFDVEAEVRRLMKSASDRKDPMTLAERLASLNRSIDIAITQAEIIAVTRDFKGFLAATSAAERAASLISILRDNEAGHGNSLSEDQKVRVIEYIYDDRPDNPESLQN